MLILKYVEQHPNAKDTAAGIAEWWVRQPSDLVESALELLMDLGFVIGTNVGASGTIFEAAEDKTEEMRAWCMRFE